MDLRQERDRLHTILDAMRDEAERQDRHDWRKVRVIATALPSGLSVFKDRALGMELIADYNTQGRSLVSDRAKTQAEFVDRVMSYEDLPLALPCIEDCGPVNEYRCALCKDTFFDFRDKLTLKFDRDMEFVSCAKTGCDHVPCTECWSIVQEIKANEKSNDLVCRSSSFTGARASSATYSIGLVRWCWNLRDS